MHLHSHHADHGGHSHHDHHHGHDHGPLRYDKAFALGVGLNLVYVGLEAGFGLFTGSLALLADAGHNLSDVLSLVLAWGAAVLARRGPTRKRTYGFSRTTILASLANAGLLLMAVGGISWEALRRFGHPQDIPAGTVLWVASVGIVVNTATALLFFSGRREDLNIRGAYLHMAADAAVSLGVVAAALAIQFTGAAWIDPAVSLAIALVIALGTWGLLKDSLNLALDAVPSHIDADAVRAFLESAPGVESVHDLHIWGLSTTTTALTAHLVRPEHHCDDAFLAWLARELEEQHNIQHMTIQIEDSSQTPCNLESDEVI